MVKYDGFLKDLDGEIASSKDVLGQIEKIQADLQKMSALHQAFLKAKIANREEFGFLKRLSSERAAAASFIMSALVNGLPVSCCDEAR